MTYIGPIVTQFLPEDLSWDLTPDHDMTYKPGDTLDPSLFNAGQHYPNGYIPSGTLLGRKTSGALLGPYLDSLSNGQQTCVGILAATVKVVNDTGSLRGKIGVAVVRAFAVVSASKLPLTSGTAALGGYLDAAAKADLPLIFFDA